MPNQPSSPTANNASSSPPSIKQMNNGYPEYDVFFSSEALHYQHWQCMLLKKTLQQIMPKLAPPQQATVQQIMASLSQQIANNSCYQLARTQAQIHYAEKLRTNRFDYLDANSQYQKAEAQYQETHSPAAQWAMEDMNRKRQRAQAEFDYIKQHSPQSLKAVSFTPEVTLPCNQIRALTASNLTATAKIASASIDYTLFYSATSAVYLLPLLEDALIYQQYQLHSQSDLAIYCMINITLTSLKNSRYLSNPNIQQAWQALWQLFATLTIENHLINLLEKALLSTAQHYQLDRKKSHCFSWWGKNPLLFYFGKFIQLNGNNSIEINTRYFSQQLITTIIHDINQTFMQSHQQKSTSKLANYLLSNLKAYQLPLVNQPNAILNHEQLIQHFQRNSQQLKGLHFLPDYKTLFTASIKEKALQQMAVLIQAMRHCQQKAQTQQKIADEEHRRWLEELAQSNPSPAVANAAKRRPTAAGVITTNDVAISQEKIEQLLSILQNQNTAAKCKEHIRQHFIPLFQAKNRGSTQTKLHKFYCYIKYETGLWNRHDNTRHSWAQHCLNWAIAIEPKCKPKSPSSPITPEFRF